METLPRYVLQNNFLFLKFECRTGELYSFILEVGLHLLTLLYSSISVVKRVQMQSFFWYVFYRIRAQYGDLRSKSPYLFRIQENTDQKKLRI